MFGGIFYDGIQICRFYLRWYRRRRDYRTGCSGVLGSFDLRGRSFHHHPVFMRPTLPQKEIK